MNIDQRVERLEKSNRRYRVACTFAILAGVIGCTMAMQKPIADELQVRKLSIVDAQGNLRWEFGSGVDRGDNGVTHYDQNGVMRMFMGTYANDDSVMQYYDTDGDKRIQTGTFPNGHARMTQYDQRGQDRIVMETLPRGQASVQFYDLDGKR